jgi:hypothetical protein
VSLSCFTLAGKEQVLLQVGDFITSSPELQLGSVLLMKLRAFAGLYSSTETAVDT